MQSKTINSSGFNKKADIGEVGLFTEFTYFLFTVR